MITQTNVPVYLDESLPEMRPELQKNRRPRCPQRVFCRSMPCWFYPPHGGGKNRAMARRCLAMVAALNNKGNVVVKHAVENIYVYSFSWLLNSCIDHRKEIYSRLISLMCWIKSTVRRYCIPACEKTVLLTGISLLVNSRHFNSARHFVNFIYENGKGKT